MPLYTSEILDAKPAVDEEEVRPNMHLDTIVVNVSVPTLTGFLPSADKATGSAVIICPGERLWRLIDQQGGICSCSGVPAAGRGCLCAEIPVAQ